MNYRLPIGTEIIPASINTGREGIPALTTVAVDFNESDILQRVKRIINNEEIDFMRLPLDDNPSPYDSYLFRSEDVEEGTG